MSERAVGFLVVVLVASAGFIGALVWGITGVVTIFAATILWLLWYISALVDQLEEARADVDDLGGEVARIKAHLTATEPEGTGRHADGQPATYRPSPRPHPRPFPSPETTPMTQAHPDLETRSA